MEVFQKQPLLHQVTFVLNLGEDFVRQLLVMDELEEGYAIFHKMLRPLEDRKGWPRTPL